MSKAKSEMNSKKRTTTLHWTSAVGPKKNEFSYKPPCERQEAKVSKISIESIHFVLDLISGSWGEWNFLKTSLWASRSKSEKNSWKRASTLRWTSSVGHEKNGFFFLISPSEHQEAKVKKFLKRISTLHWTSSVG